MGKASHKLPLRLVYTGKTLDLFFYLCSHLIEALTYLCQFRISIFRYLDLIVPCATQLAASFSLVRGVMIFRRLKKRRVPVREGEKLSEHLPGKKGSDFVQEHW